MLTSLNNVKVSISRFYKFMKITAQTYPAQLHIFPRTTPHFSLVSVFHFAGFAVYIVVMDDFVFFVQRNKG